jgi:ribosomal protein S18 acetylase RimI-like enzyme
MALGTAPYRLISLFLNALSPYCSWFFTHIPQRSIAVAQAQASPKYAKPLTEIPPLDSLHQAAYIHYHNFGEHAMINITSMEASLYDQTLALWVSVLEGRVSPAFDTRERITAYLLRNPGCSSVAWDGGRLVGAVMCGHDGRRGLLLHMVVAADYRGQGIGRRLVTRSVEQLRACGIDSAYIFTDNNNPGEGAFWSALGWKLLPSVQYRYLEFTSQ